MCGGALHVHVASLPSTGQTLPPNTGTNQFTETFDMVRPEVVVKANGAAHMKALKGRTHKTNILDMSQRTSATHGSRSTNSQKIQCTIPRLCSHDQLGSRGLRKRVPPCDPCHRLQQPACCSHGLKKSVFCGVCSRSNPQVDRVFVN